MKRRAVLAGFGAALAMPVLAPRAAAAVPVDSSAAQADGALLVRIFDALHPGLLAYQSESGAAAAAAALDRRLATAATVADAYVALHAYTATLRCGHTYPNPLNQRDALRASLFGTTPRVPFAFAWIDRRMIVTADAAGLHAGDEIVSINGVASAAILARLLTYARADGSNDAKRIDQLGVTGRERYATFDVLHPLLYPAQRAYELRVRRFAGGRIETIRVAPSTDADRASVAAATGAGAPSGTVPAFTLDDTDTRAAVLRMPTWALYNSAWDWRAAIEAAFERLAARRTPALVVDLRGNEGGLEAIGDALLAHLVDAPLTRPAARRLVRYRRVADEFVPYLTTYDPSLKDWGDAAVRDDARFYRLTDAATSTIVPRGPRYRGRVAVLVDAANSSATFNFAQQVRTARAGALVGAPTGGNRRGINGGGFFFVRLPNTQLEIDLPLIAQRPATPQPDAGLEPDVLAVPSVGDVARGRDVALTAARRIIA